MKKLVFLFSLVCGISYGQTLTTKEFVMLVKTEDPGEVEDYLEDRKFMYMMTEKQEGHIRLYKFQSADSRSYVERRFSKEPSKDYLLIETEDESWVEQIKKNLKSAAYLLKKEIQEPATHMYNRTYTYEFEPAKNEGFKYRIKMYRTNK